MKEKVLSNKFIGENEKLVKKILAEFGFLILKQCMNEDCLSVPYFLPIGTRFDENRAYVKDEIYHRKLAELMNLFNTKVYSSIKDFNILPFIITYQKFFYSILKYDLEHEKYVAPFYAIRNTDDMNMNLPFSKRGSGALCPRLSSDDCYLDSIHEFLKKYHLNGLEV